MGNSVYLGDESGDIAGVTEDSLSGGGTSGTDITCIRFK